MDVTQPRHFAYLLGFIIAVGPVSVDMYLPAFAQIAQRFGAGVPQLTLASYFAGFAAGQLTQGFLSDRFGRSAPLVAGLETAVEEMLRRRILDDARLPYVRVTLEPSWRLHRDMHPDARGAQAIAIAIAGRLSGRLP